MQQGCGYDWCALSCMQDSSTFPMWKVEKKKKIDIFSFDPSEIENLEFLKTNGSKTGSLNLSVCSFEVLNWRFSAGRKIWSEFLTLQKSVNFLSLALVGTAGYLGCQSC